MADRYHVFLSYSRGDLDAAVNLRSQLDRHGLSVFWDQESIRAGERWLSRLEEAVGACGSFIVLVGRDGVRGWIGAETQAALNRYFGARDDAERLPIFPILLGETGPDTLPAFLRLFQAMAWNGADRVPERLLEAIRDQVIVTNEAFAFDGCPFVGLDAFRVDQAQLFFGRQKETLDALACFEARRGSRTIRWLEINGNSGSGKSSLMNAGLLPLVDQGWLWPRTGFEHWRRIGPMMPGEHPVAMLAEQLARCFNVEMTDLRLRLEGDEHTLAEWLRSRKQSETAFLLAIDQFEELFTFANPDERGSFDCLLAGALEDPDCPLFVISTVRADFLDRFELLPRLVATRNRSGVPWTLPPIGADGLREVIAGPARLAELDVSEIKEAMVAEACAEPGALPLVQNALQWLWEQRTDGRLSGQLFTDQGGLAGILSHNADSFLKGLDRQRERALELLFRLVNVDPEGRRHTRRQIPLAEAIAVAGGGARGQALVNRLAGERARDDRNLQGPLRLITVVDEAQRGTTSRAHDQPEGGTTPGAPDRWVSLIHETLIRSKGLAAGKTQPYWPTLWNYIEQHKDQAARRERLQHLVREWKDRKGLGRLLGLAGWVELWGFRRLATPGSIEQSYLRWSIARSLALACVLAAFIALVGEAGVWASVNGLPLEAVGTRWAYKLGRELPLPGLVAVPEGEFERQRTFQMGTVDGDAMEQPEHPVTFAQPFYLGRTEVTFAQYQAFARATGRPQPNNFGFVGDDRPAINVDWSDARAYANWLGAMTDRTCRLPSEAEWEYACRAGTRKAYAVPAPDGSDEIRGSELANCDGCGGEWQRQTAPVESFDPNAWNLFNMHGNVAEWVEDCWHRTYEGAPADGQAWKKDGDCNYRVLRGGSWNSYYPDARCASRNWVRPNSRDNRTGFRVLCSLPSTR